jgi:hypothetical protein
MERVVALGLAFGTYAPGGGVAGACRMACGPPPPVHRSRGRSISSALRHSRWRQNIPRERAAWWGPMAWATWSAHWHCSPWDWPVGPAPPAAVWWAHARWPAGLPPGDPPIHPHARWLAGLPPDPTARQMACPPHARAHAVGPAGLFVVCCGLPPPPDPPYHSRATLKQ